MDLVSELVLYFDEIQDKFVIPNTYNLSLPKVKCRTNDDITYTIEINDLASNQSLDSGSYTLDQSGGQAFFIIKNFK